MSDDDFMAEDEEFDFEYEDDDDEEPDVNLENLYYSAKALKEDNPMVAVDEFQKLVQNEQQKSEWGFKALKQTIKILFKKHDYQRTLENYKNLLSYTKNAVTRNYAEKSINNILDNVSTSPDQQFLESFYSVTLKSLEESQNERLWLKTNLKLAKLWLDRNEFSRLTKIIRLLRQTCQNDDGTDDQRKGTLLLEIFALEIQMYNAMKNTKKLKSVYLQCLQVKSAISHPKIMGVIREQGGKMHMIESCLMLTVEEWEKAQIDFFEAFKNYDEAGSPQRIQCLKYLVLANMLMESQINPFDSQETKPYKNDPQITAMTDLVNAFQRKDINEFEKILGKNRKDIMDDPFIRDYIDDLLKNIRMQVLQKLLKPYTRIKLGFISKELNITVPEVEELLVSLILDEKISAKVDQMKQIVELTQE